MYWCDSRMDTIERMDYDGSNRVILLDRTHLENPHGVAMFQDQLFWIDTSSNGGSLFQVRRISSSFKTFKLMIFITINSLLLFHVRMNDLVYRRR